MDELVDRLEFRNRLGLTPKTFKRYLDCYVGLFGEVVGVTERKVPLLVAGRIERAVLMLRAEGTPGLSFAGALALVKSELPVFEAGGVGVLEGEAFESVVAVEVVDVTEVVEVAEVEDVQHLEVVAPVDVAALLVRLGAVEARALRAEADVGVLRGELVRLNDRVGGFGRRVEAVGLRVLSFKFELLAACASAASADEKSGWLMSQVQFRERWFKKNLPELFKRVGLDVEVGGVVKVKGKNILRVQKN